MDQGYRRTAFRPDDEPTEIITLPPGWAQARPADGASLELAGPVRRRTARTDWSRTAARVTGYLTGLIQGLLIVRFLFHLIGANPAAPAAQWVDALSAPLLFPFEGILPVPRAGDSAVELPVLCAVAVYTVLGFLLKRLFGLWRRAAYSSRTAPPTRR